MRHLTRYDATDPSVPPGCVEVRPHPQYRDAILVIHPSDLPAVLGLGALAALRDLYGSSAPGRYVIPEAVLVDDTADALAEGSEVAAALRMLSPADEPYCQHPPCILPTEARRVGYSLCGHHDQVLTEAARWAFGAEVDLGPAASVRVERRVSSRSGT